MVAWNHTPKTEYYTLTQAARIAGLSRQGIWLHVQAGSLPAAKLGNYYIIRAEDFDAWMQNRKAGNNEPPPVVRARKNRYME